MPRLDIPSIRSQTSSLSRLLPRTSTQEARNLDATEMLALNIYTEFYGSDTAARGFAQAKAVVLFVFVAALGLLQLKFTREKEVQQ